MEKINEKEFSTFFAKYYRCDQKIDTIKLLEEFKKLGLQFDEVYMSRDAEMDMQMGQGYYNLEELKEALDCYRTGSACEIEVSTIFNGIKVKIKFTDEEQIIVMCTPDSSLELIDLYNNEN